VEDRLLELVDAYLENRLTDPETGELRELLRTSPEARQTFWEYVEQHVLIDDLLAEARGRDLALAEEAAPGSSGVRGCRPVIGDSTPSPQPLSPKGRGASQQSRHLDGGRHFSAWAGALTAVAAGLLLAVGLWWRAPAPEPLAMVRALGGDVQVIDLSGKMVPVTTDAPLAVGQALHVGDEDSQAEVSFADGTQVTLGAGTDLRFPASARKEARRLHLDRGAVQVQAAAPALVVTTDHARITASATRFRLYREATASRVELEEGKVRLESPAGTNAVEVDEGSFAVATAEARPMVPQPLPPSHCRLRHTLLRAGDAVCFSRDGTGLIASHFSRGWKAWDTHDGTLRAAAPGSGQRASGLALTPDGATAVALGNAGTAMLWKIGEPQPVKTRLREKQLRCGAVSADGRWLAQGTGTGEVALWEADPGHGSISLRQSVPLKPSRVVLSCVGPHLAVSRWGGDILVFEAKTGREVGRYKLRRTPAPLALSADGRYLAAYASSDGLVLFDRQADARHTLWPGEVTRVEHVEFSADGRTVLAGLDDGTVRAWATADGRPVLVLDTGHRLVNRVTASADQSLLATVGDNDCVKVWECALR